MIGLNLELISLGLDLADKVIGLCRGNDKLQEDRLIDLIGDSTESLKNAIQIGAEQVIYKIEQDKMEELISRLKNIDMLIRMKNQEHLLGYLLQVQESVDYAKNRLDEGKQQWFTPYLIGKSMVYAAFTYIGNESPQMRQELLQTLDDIKIKILDEISLTLIQNGRTIPWHVVKDFLDNKTGSLNEIVKLLPEKGTEKLESSEVQDQDNVERIAYHAGNFSEKLRKICAPYEESEHCFFDDSIPIKKLENAIKYFKIPANENVIFLCDSTVFRSCKVGFAICEHGVYWGVDWATTTKRTKLTWQELSEREIKLSDTKIYLGRGDYIDTVIVRKREEMVNLFNEIKDFVKQVDFPT